jgi:hypothetical protein
VAILGDPTRRRSVLDPIERVSEVIFGVLMALSFTGALSVATAGREEVRTMMLTALGCNLAWGLTDAVMYLVGTVVERSRKAVLLREAAGARLAWTDYAGALEVFGLVVLATFPVVIPFVFFREAALALRVSNGLAVATLFAGGYSLGRHAGASPWRFGLAMAGIGVVLVGAIVALGG